MSIGSSAASIRIDSGSYLTTGNANPLWRKSGRQLVTPPLSVVKESRPLARAKRQLPDRTTSASNQPRHIPNRVSLSTCNPVVALWRCVAVKSLCRPFPKAGRRKIRLPQGAAVGWIRTTSDLPGSSRSTAVAVPLSMLHGELGVAVALGLYCHRYFRNSLEPIRGV